MRVGIVMGGTEPTAGGGYTFEMSLVHALSEIGGADHHEFILFAWDEETAANLSRSSLHIVTLSTGEPDDNKGAIRSFLGRIPVFRTIVSRMERRSTRSPEDVLLSALRVYGIDIVWYLSCCLATRGLTVELPFITIVWDLQHRVQPYFSEVSAKGLWEHREQIYSRVLRRASAILVGTKTGKAEVERFYAVHPERIHILPMPVPKFAHEEPDGSVLLKYDIPKGYLFYPAQFWPHKNHVNLLLAVRRLRDLYGLAFPVVFTGFDHGNLSYIKRVVEDLGLSKLVHILGFVPGEDMNQLYRNAFALTFVTFFGPDNIPPLEGFALRCPVIASRVSGSEEQLGDCALLVDPGNPDDIAQAIKRLHDDPSLRSDLVNRAAGRADKSKSKDYVQGVFRVIGELEPMLRCWNTGGEQDNREQFH